MERREVFCLECNYEGHSKTDHLEQMNREREQDLEFEKRYYSGEQIPASEFKENDSRLEFFGETVFPDLKNNKETAQFDLWGELWHQRNKPIDLIEGEVYNVEFRDENGKSRIYSE